MIRRKKAKKLPWETKRTLKKAGLTPEDLIEAGHPGGKKEQ